jgi:hypothetical protein
VTFLGNFKTFARYVEAYLTDDGLMMVVKENGEELLMDPELFKWLFRKVRQN